MKTLILTFITLCIYPFIYGQKIELQSFPAEDFENISVKKLYSNGNASSFQIWVKKHVQPHLHNNHTEHVYILDGRGIMLFGDSTFTVQKGDLIAIPPKTVHAVKTQGYIPLQAISIQAPQFFNEDREWIEVEKWSQKIEKP